MLFSFSRLFVFPLFVALFLIETGYAQKVKSAPFTHVPDASGEQYHQQIPHKSLPVSATDFIVLRRTSDQAFSVERYGSDLKAKWSAPIPLLGQETVESFSQHGQTALLVTHRVMADQGSQALYGKLIDLATGNLLQQKKLLEAPSRSRKLNVSISEDGSKLVAYHSITRNEQLRSIQATVYDGTLNKLKERTYDFASAGEQVAAQVYIDNHGNQFVSILTDNSMRLSVRRYNNRDNEIKVMEVTVGGVFSGEKMYVVDTKFQLHQDSSLYAAVLVAEEKTGEYRSLKMVRFDYKINDMRFAEEFQFTPAFTQQLLKSTGAKRLEDIYLSDILISDEGQALVIAEKKFTEGGANSPYHAQELLLFAYDEYLQPTWNSVILKNQIAPATDGFAGTSYSSRLFGNRLQLLTLETLNGKTDLYSRSIHLLTGASEAPKPLKLSLAPGKQIAYIKDFTTWLDERTIATVARPAKGTSDLRLHRIILK